MSFLDWIYPPKCMACRQVLPIQEKEWRRFRLCAGCHALFERIRPPVCGKCGCPLDTDASEGGFSGVNTGGGENAPGGCPSCFGREYAFAGNQAFFTYDGVMRDIILDIKFHGRKQSAVGLGELWASVISAGNGRGEGGAEPGGRAAAGGDFKDAVLVPVPMYPRKTRARGFNQAEILAAAVAEKTGAEMKADLLKRTVNTPPQSGLTARSRAENVRGVFKLNGKYNIKAMKIILIDDIFTTGASLNACAEVLAEAGAGKITCMTLSIAVKNKNKDDTH